MVHKGFDLFHLGPSIRSDLLCTDRNADQPCFLRNPYILLLCLFLETFVRWNDILKTIHCTHSLKKCSCFTFYIPIICSNVLDQRNLWSLLWNISDHLLSIISYLSIISNWKSTWSIKQSDQFKKKMWSFLNKRVTSWPKKVF